MIKVLVHYEILWLNGEVQQLRGGNSGRGAYTWESKRQWEWEWAKSRIVYLKAGKQSITRCVVDDIGVLESGEDDDLLK